MSDAGHSSTLAIDAWQHSSNIAFATHVVEQGPHAGRGVDDHSAGNVGSVVGFSCIVRSCRCATAVKLQESTRAQGARSEGARAEGVGA